MWVISEERHFSVIPSDRKVGVVKASDNREKLEAVRAVLLRDGWPDWLDSSWCSPDGVAHVVLRPGTPDDVRQWVEELAREHRVSVDKGETYFLPEGPSGTDYVAKINAESQRTVALAAQLLGLTEPEVLVLVDTHTPPGYRVHFIEEGADNNCRLYDLDPRRMYLFTENGKVVRYEAGR